MSESVTDDWKVEIVTKGRDGNIVYQENSNAASFYREFGGGDVVAIIHVPTESDWQKKFRWAANRRAEVLDRVAADVIRQKCGSCVASVVEERGNSYLYLRQRG